MARSSVRSSKGVVALEAAWLRSGRSILGAVVFRLSISAKVVLKGLFALKTVTEQITPSMCALIGGRGMVIRA